MRAVAMKIAMLFSGGKDSNLALHRLVRAGHEVAALVTALPSRSDSWMFHCPNAHLASAQAECLGIPWEPIPVSGSEGIEVSELERGIQEVQRRRGIEALGTGAIASRYQRSRIDEVCSRLGLECASPLWGEDEESLLRELVKLSFEVYFASVSAEGLTREWLGRRLDQGAISSLLSIKERYKINISGEGGEYETFVADSPLFRSKIRITSASSSWHRNWGVWEISSYEIIKKT